MKEGKLGTHLHGESEHWRPDHHTLNQPSTGRAGIPFSCHPEAARPEGAEKDPREGSIPSLSVVPGAPLAGGAPNVTPRAGPTALTHSGIQSERTRPLCRRERVHSHLLGISLIPTRCQYSNFQGWGKKDVIRKQSYWANLKTHQLVSGNGAHTSEWTKDTS